jgi:hypothetical protein
MRQACSGCGNPNEETTRYCCFCGVVLGSEARIDRDLPFYEGCEMAPKNREAARTALALAPIEQRHVVF